MLSALGVSLVPLTGCMGMVTSPDSDTTESDTVADIQFDNKTSEELTVTLRIDTDGQQLLKETFTLAPGGPDDHEPEKTYMEVVGDETATVHVSVENGPEENYEFTDTEIDVRGLFVDIYTSQITFQVAAA